MVIEPDTKPETVGTSTPSCCEHERAVRREAVALLRRSEENADDLRRQVADLELRLERALLEGRRLGQALERAQTAAQAAVGRADRLQSELTILQTSIRAEGSTAPETPPASRIDQALRRLLRGRAGAGD